MSTSRIHTLRALALVVMLLGVAAAVWQIGVGIKDVGHAMHYTYRIGEQFSAQHAAEKAVKVAIWVMAAKLLVCQILIGGGGFARYKLKKMLAVSENLPTSATV